LRDKRGKDVLVVRNILRRDDPKNLSDDAATRVVRTEDTIAAKLREPLNALTHLVGVLLSAIALGVLVWLAIRTRDSLHVVGFTIFGVSQLAVFTVSTLYHALVLPPASEARLRRIDHMMIFVLIAGTYTPFCLVALHGRWRWGLLGVIWGFALGGIVLKTRWMHAPRWFSTLLYIAMGWLAILAAPMIVHTLPAGAVGGLLTGGIVYSIGAIIYARKWPNPIPGVFEAHALWHMFVLAGSACFFWVVLVYLAT
jgi:hemolysin III